LSTSALTVRPLVSPEEYQHYYYLAAVAFGSPPYEEDARSWQSFVTHSPEFRSEQVRGVFRNGQLLGGYTMNERVLRMGEARISTGCIGAVVTDPTARKQGAASVLLRDAQAFAQENNHALLMLDGIPNFYYRFGYTDVFDATAVEIDRSAILAQAPTAYGVRAATSEDAGAILALYYRHFGGSTGSFERSPEVQTYRLLQARRPPVVALSPSGEIEGYLFHDTGDEIAQGREVAADNWEALLTLLQYHARLLPDEPATPTLLYFLPHNAPMTQWMIDTLEVPDTSQWHSAAQEWGVRSLTYHHRFTGWMASLVNFSHVMSTLLPELQARWRRSLAQWNGAISLLVDGYTCVLRPAHFADPTVQLDAPPASSKCQLELTPQEFLQGIFGYRPFAQQRAAAGLPDDVRAALAILFPAGHTWLPRTDWF
jgi:hypothetical protein